MQRQGSVGQRGMSRSALVDAVGLSRGNALQTAYPKDAALETCYPSGPPATQEAGEEESLFH